MSGRGRGRGRGQPDVRGYAGRRNAAKSEPVTNAASQILLEAEVLQQRADRRRSPAAYQQAADAFQQAIATGQASQGGLGAERLSDAFFGLGECLQCCAEAVTAACAALPDERLTCAAEEDAQQAALELLQRAVSAFEQGNSGVRTAAAGASVAAEHALALGIDTLQVREGPPEELLRVDALVAAGNALASAAELASPPQAIALLAAAGEAYGAALGRDEDAGTLSNAADAWVAAAQHLCEAGRQTEGAALFAQAMQAYQRSCELSSSEEGDDLPDLLHNWGVGLYGMGCQAARVDPPTAAPVLEEAAARLAASIAFNRADVAPMNAMGDVRLAQSELLAVAEPDAAAAAALAALEQGYSAALQVSSRDPDALIGTAEAHAQLGKLAAAAGDAGAATAHWARSADAYAAALGNPAALGSLEERCNARYNCACVCAQSGRHGDAQQLLQALLEASSTTREDLLRDPDLECVRGLPWFAQLVPM